MNREQDPFEGVQAEGFVGRVALRFLRFGWRHPHWLTVLWLGMTVLLFVVFWQLFGLVVGGIALVLFLMFQLGLWVSNRHVRWQ